MREFFEKNPRFAHPLHRAPHAAGATAADRLAEIAPFIGKSAWEIRALRAKSTVEKRRRR